MNNEGFEKMICRITDNPKQHPDDMTPEEEAMQEQAEEERDARIDQITDQMKLDADVINDALLADNELAFEIAGIIAECNKEIDGDYTKRRDTYRSLAMYEIDEKLTAALRAMAVTEIDGE